MTPKYIAYGFDNFIKTFQDAYHENKANYQQNINEFLQCLDPASQTTLQHFHELILKLPLPSKDFLVKKSSIYNQQELQQLAMEDNFYKNIHNYYQLYQLQGDEKLTINVFKYHCGLKLLPSEVTKNLYHKVFIDCGAFYGDSALVFKRYKPTKIICFEPNSINFNRLKITMKKNNINSCLVNQGVSNSQGEKRLYFVSEKLNHGASYLFQAQKCKSELTPLTSLDNFLFHSIEDIGLIKLDTEGYSSLIIEGAINTISKYKPVISCAIYHNPAEMFKIYKILQHCCSNYQFKVVALSQAEVLKDLTLLAY